MKTLYLIDASGYLYRSYFAIRNMTNQRGESTNALFGFVRSLLKLFKDFQPEHLVAVFDGPRNGQARKALYADYKAHRSQLPADLGYQIDWARHCCDLMGIPYLNIAEVEADDVIGSVVRWAEKRGVECYICSGDKDLCQLVSDKIFILNTHKDNQILGEKEVEETFGVAPQQIVDLLALIGDASDNVPGVAGIGPKTAIALLKQFGSLNALLEHPEEVSGKKKQEILIQEREKALLSRRLVTIDTAVTIPEESDFYLFQTPDKTALKSFYASMSFNSLIKELELLPNGQAVGEKGSAEEMYCLVDDEASLQQLLALLQQSKEICFDTETTHWQAMKAELVGIGFGIEEKKAFYLPANGKLGLQRVIAALKPLFESSSYHFYGHNVKYDLQVLANYGISVANLCFDTILASYLLNSHSRQHSLDHLALERFGKVKIPIQSLIGKGKNEISMQQVPIEKVVEYCCEDVDYTCRLKSVLQQELKERQLLPLLFDLELPLVSVLAKMERAGIYVDCNELEKLSDEIAERIDILAEEIYALAGEEFNLNSPKQLSDILFKKLRIPAPKKTATGLSTSAQVLEMIRYLHPIADKLLDYRTLEKLRSTYVSVLPLEVNPITYRIHCNFNQTVAATGRLSSQDPNLQNIPTRTEVASKIRLAFKPQWPHWSFLSADYSQIELRLLAHLSEDPLLLDAFAQGEDIHARTAAAIFNVPLAQVTKEMRYQAKAVNFGVIYGQQAFGLAQGLGIDVKRASAFIDAYFARYRRVKEFIEECKRKAASSGKAVTMTLRERLIPEIKSNNHNLRLAAERLAVNTPLQGTAADLIKMAMLRVDKELTQGRYRTKMILQIHDELLFEVADEELAAIEKLVKRAMEEVVALKVPLVVNIAIGKNWKEC